MIFSATRGFAFLGLLATVVAAADPVEMYRRHRYAQAVELWRQDSEAKKVDEKALRAWKGTALAYHQLGALYLRLAGFSETLSADYYAGVLEQASEPRANLYLGQILFHAGKTAEAAAQFSAASKFKFPSGALEADLLEVYQEAVKGKGEGLKRFTSGEKAWLALDLRGVGPEAIPQGLEATDARERRSQLSLLTRSKKAAIDEVEALIPIVEEEGQQPEAVGDLGKSTQLNFYDPFVLRVLGRGYLALSKWTNERLLGQEKAFPALTAKFNTRLAMAESALLLEQPSEAMTILEPETGFDAERLRARALAQSGNTKDAVANLKRLAAASRSASQKRDLAETFAIVGDGIDQGLSLISDALRDKPSSPYHRAHANLLLANGQADLAIKAFARGYKIENRNRIDQIDPEYMCDYSRALYDNYKLRYEEIVETLYHLQKEYPAARSMYYAMQGISAGMARNYDANPIFRKGG